MESLPEIAKVGVHPKLAGLVLVKPHKINERCKNWKNSRFETLGCQLAQEKYQMLRDEMIS
jgi:hypothetical protein